MVNTYGMSVAQQELVWVRWRRGDSFGAIGRDFGMKPHHVRRYVGSCGGVKPVAVRCPSNHLSAVDREEISRGLAAGESFRTIGVRLGRPHTTVSREVARNGGRSRYRAGRAMVAAIRRRRRPKQSKLSAECMLRRQVESWLRQDWSPEQISHRLRSDHPRDRSMQISHESIYLSIYQGYRRGLRRGLHAHLRSGRPMRNPKRARASNGRGRIKNMTPITERPTEADAREVIGHIEGDLIMGKRPSAVVTLVDRSTRQVKIVALPRGIKALPVRQALVDHLTRLPTEDRKTLTWDRGREMAQHQELTEETGCQVFFCEPQSPWQRGTNENTNRLLRQYLSKAADLSSYSQTELDRIALRLNSRPRKTLGWRTPNEAYAEATGAFTH
jgi:IS30 family transposase